MQINICFIYTRDYGHTISGHTHTPSPPHIWDSKDSRSWDCNHIQCHCNYTLMCCTVQIVYSEFKYYLISKYERNNIIDAIFLILQTAILEKLSERTICVFQKSLKNIVYMCSVYIYIERPFKQELVLSVGWIKYWMNEKSVIEFNVYLYVQYIS